MSDLTTLNKKSGHELKRNRYQAKRSKGQDKPAYAGDLDDGEPPLKVIKHDGTSHDKNAALKAAIMDPYDPPEPISSAEAAKLWSSSRPAVVVPEPVEAEPMEASHDGKHSMGVTKFDGIAQLTTI